MRIWTFDEALADVKERFKCVPFEFVPDRCPSVAPTGEKYIVIRGIGITERNAAKEWLVNILAKGRGHSIIYWRVEPEYESIGKKHVIYSRLVFA